MGRYRRCVGVCLALTAAVFLWSYAAGATVTDSERLALAPRALDGDGMDRMRDNAQIKQDLAVVAEAVQSNQSPGGTTLGRLQKNFRELYADSNVQAVLFPGYPGLIVYVPSQPRQYGKVIVYHVRDQKGEPLSQAVAKTILARLFSGRGTPNTHPYKRYAVTTTILDAKNGDGLRRVLAQGNSTGDSGAAYLEEWIRIRSYFQDDEVEYLLRMAGLPQYRSAAMMGLATSNRPEAIDKMTEILETAHGQAILGMSDAVSIQFLTEYFDEKNWTIYRNKMVAVATEVGPRLFDAFGTHYKRFDESEKSAGYQWALAMMALLPVDFPAPRFFLDELVWEEVRKFHVEFPEVLTSMLEVDPRELIEEFLAKMRFLPLGEAIEAVGISYARDVGLAFHERKGIVTFGRRGVESIVFPEGLSFREFEEAFWHNWVQFLSAKGAYGNILELPEVMGRLAFQDRNNYPLKYRILQDYVLEGWDRETMEIINEARRPFDHLPAMQRVAKEFPRRYFYLRWLLGERFFRGLYGLYLAHLIYEITVYYPENAQLTFELSKEFARRLMAGVPPARAYEEAFAMEFAREKIFRTDIFVSPEARRLALEEEARCASAL